MILEFTAISNKPFISAYPSIRTFLKSDALSSNARECFSEKKFDQ